ncbi:hypothetical protein V22_18690 [Calycomorphotria hydatis]|uniref:Uncharacterized protein n=1 Tax=Calycomorphotria hydatis TaxID=2528027 RepID=A0A517T8D4_9PLAN|nr:hypothetical protein V22_18690 [Calycomorphotria hydatis]
MHTFNTTITATFNTTFGTAAGIVDADMVHRFAHVVPQCSQKPYPGKRSVVRSKCCPSSLRQRLCLEESLLALNPRGNWLMSLMGSMDMERSPETGWATEGIPAFSRN